MADAIAAYKTAFSSFKKNMMDYAIYSILFSAISAVLGVIVFVAFMAFGFVTVGTFAGMISAGNAFSLDAAGMVVTILLMLAGLFIFTLLQCGLIGAYLETLGGLLSDKKQTLVGFISAVPRLSGHMLIAFFITGIITAIPTSAGFAIAFLVGFSSIPGIAAIILGIFLSYLLSLLFIFVPPAVAVERRGAIEAMKSSVSQVVKNPVAFVIFLVISTLIAIPSFTVIYVPLFLLPVGQAALVAFRKS
ncbi:MAG: hypothetical protein WCT52_05340 [Candidatus Micrarchaeia archaeon]